MADTSDVDIIAELEQICFAIPWTRESILRELEENSMALYFIAEIDGTPVGYGGMWIIVDEGHIINIAVLPQFRGRHIASLLMAVLIAFGETRGVTRFTLEVRSSNEPAKAVYRKFLFKEEGLRRGYYQDNGEDAIIMWRDPNEPLKN
ncbi:MAG: ribosomal protein S18-alanine N-acetyltransferase [Firmicutes bacterium]|nr:ribosomal protein S18-alanine N-acetyltransferase [Bacillota bacterium]